MKQHVHPEVIIDVLSTLHNSMPVGVEVTDQDWNDACRLVKAQYLFDTLVWKYNNLNIGEYQK